MALSLLVLLAPALALQVVVEFALQIDWSGVDASFRRYTLTLNPNPDPDPNPKP